MLLPSEPPMLAATSLTAFISIEFGMKMPGCPSVSYTASSTGIIVPAYSLSLIHIFRAQNYATLVPGKKSERTVFTMAKFTIPDDKCIVVELNEKNGGRHQSFVIENEDLVRANTCLLYTSNGGSRIVTDHAGQVGLSVKP